MVAAEIIAKKRDGLALTVEEIQFFVAGVTTGSVPDYQVSAWLMAVFLRGMNAEETLALTLAMRDSGECIDPRDLSGSSDVNHIPTLDKHSTGGVGDKTTLVVVPILAACGVPMLKMSGRGLGYSGGTVDKMESIPGLRTNLTLEEAKAQVRRSGAALIGQSQTLAPADKSLYSLRDVTATVESVPLIASSIMSKKLASGGQRIVLDVKVGSGAFMKTREQARNLARELVRIGNSAGVPTSAVLTGMEEPLGRAVGNALEVKEAVELLLHAEGEPKFQNLCLALAAHGLMVVGKAANQEEAMIQAGRQLMNGQAAKKFAEIVAAQGGPATCEEILTALPIAPIQYAVSTNMEGTVVQLNAETIGRLSVAMGAGRHTKTDTIDPAVGIVLHYKCGEVARAGTALATLHVRKEDQGRAEEWADIVRSAYALDCHAAPSITAESLVLEVIE